MSTLLSRTVVLATDLWASPWLRPLNDPAAVDGLLALVWPTWSRTTVRAQIVGTIREAANVRTLILRPSAKWAGHRAGQHVSVEAEVKGRRLGRTFSLSSAPRLDGLIEITVKRSQDARVSAWWNETAELGDVVTLGQPTGEFVLPDVLPERLVMIAAGSGVTPIRAMLQEIDTRSKSDSTSRVLFLHCARTRDELIFGRELEALAARCSWLDLRIHLSGEDARLDTAAWNEIVAEAGEAPSFVCGPPQFLQAAERAWAEAGRVQHLNVERFTAQRLDPEAGASAHTATASRSGRQIVVAPGQTLLEAAETAGLRPAFGCRMGVCHTCLCRKTSGSVQDVRDGRIIDEPGAMIQLCVSTPRTAVTIEL